MPDVRSEDNRNQSQPDPKQVDAPKATGDVQPRDRDQQAVAEGLRTLYG